MLLLTFGSPQIRKKGGRHKIAPIGRNSKLKYLQKET